MFLFFSLILYINLRGSNDLRLNEMVLHKTLEVKISELVVVLDLEKSGKLRIGDNLAAIVLVLELVSTDVGIDLLAYLGACHLSSRRLTKEGRELVTDKRGLHKTRGLAVTGTLRLLCGELGGSLELTCDSLLKGLEIALKRRENAKSLLDLSTKLIKLECNR